MATEIVTERVHGLLSVKLRTLKELAEKIGEKPNTLSKWLGGHAKLSISDLRRIARELESTNDYLIGDGADYRAGAETDNYVLAAAKMSFDFFKNDPTVSLEDKDLCERVYGEERLLLGAGAPVSVEGWKNLARIIARARPLPTPLRNTKTS